MDLIDFNFAREHYVRKRMKRYSKNNSIRQLKRLESKQLRSFYSSKIKSRYFSSYCEPSIELKQVNIDGTVACYNYESNQQTNDYLSTSLSDLSLANNNDDKNIESNGNYNNMSLDESEEQDYSSRNVLLHNYTMISTFDYCESFTTLSRSANLSKKSTNNLLSLIKSGLPVPNELPSNENELLNFLGVENLFQKRCICLLCYDVFDCNKQICFRCSTTRKESIAYVYDSDVDYILKKIMIRLSSNIYEYRRRIICNDDVENTKDIPFGSAYQHLLKENNYRELISLILHVDGINVTDSSKLKLWMLSGSIVELPAHLRSRRFNMVVLSIWVGYEIPPVKLWLSSSMNKLQLIKHSGINVSNINHQLVVFGVTGDCPALSLIIKFINHNGYYSCWHCYIKGEHINRRRQFRYHNYELRTSEDFRKLSAVAERSQSTIFGHRGRSEIECLLDIQFPQAIISDYLHISLLGFAKSIILSIYERLKPKQRDLFNSQMNNQQFPHFFNRKLRSMDCFGFVKGTEVRNILFYGLLPHLYLFLEVEQYSHLALYICFIRLLHSGNIFADQTSKIAHQLFIKFYKDVEIFYDNSLTFKLHLHLHLSSMYDTHGSLCNLGCFGQESLIGFVSDNHHGTRFHGDSIVHFYNIDFAVQNKKQQHITTDGPYDVTNTPTNSLNRVNSFHSIVCGCDHLSTCIKTYRRFISNKHMFHSLLYTKRHNSISYFVRYSSIYNGNENRFGIIDFFFVSNGFNYAVIKHHRLKMLFSDLFERSSYYDILKEPLDHLYFVIEKSYSKIEIISIDCILNHCVIIEKEDFILVTNILSYNEHD